MDPVIHAHMTYLIQQENKAEQRADELEDDIDLWKKRVRLAEDKGMPDLADEARQRARELIAERRSLEVDLEMIATEKKILRKESRRPKGEEVARAEEILRRWRESGLVDPEEAVLERELDDLAAEQATEELKSEMQDDQSKETGQS